MKKAALLFFLALSQVLISKAMSMEGPEYQELKGNKTEDALRIIDSNVRFFSIIENKTKTLDIFNEKERIKTITINYKKNINPSILSKNEIYIEGTESVTLEGIQIKSNKKITIKTPHLIFKECVFLYKPSIVAVQCSGETQIITSSGNWNRESKLDAPEIIIDADKIEGKLPQKPYYDGKEVEIQFLKDSFEQKNYCCIEPILENVSIHKMD